MLISTNPDTRGKEAVLYRARQITDCRWTPVRDLPSFHTMTGRILLPAGVERLGLLYSGSEPVDKFFFENVSFETFFTALANPDSVLYTKDLNGHNNSWAYYGMVCNGMARYALNIRRRFSTKRWDLVPGMHKIHDAGTYTAEDIQICDVLHAHCKGASHVAMITDVLRDEEGVIQQINALFGYGSNVSVSVEAGWNYPADFPFTADFRVKFEKATVIGGGGVVNVYPLGGTAYQAELEEEFQGDNDIGGNISSLGGYYNELKYFVEGLQGKNDLSVATVAEAIASVKLVKREIEAAGGLIVK